MATDARFGELECWTKGQLVADIYEVKGLLGIGGMGAVYRVRHKAWDVDLAVKRPSPHLLEAAGGAERFVREAETWVNLPLHPHIVTAYYVRTVGGSPAIFAECVEGGDLLAWLKRGRPSEPEALDAAIQVCWGMAAAHGRGLVHRDLKPANVLLGRGGEAKVTDFGLAKAVDAAEAPAAEAAATGAEVPDALTRAGAQVGTPMYMPPEQWLGMAAGPAADVYAFGVMLYELLCGRLPFELAPELEDAPGALRKKEYARMHMWDPPPDPAEWNPRLPAGLAALMRRCLAKGPEQRPQAFAELAALLAGFYEGLAGVPYPRLNAGELESRAVELNNRALSMLDLGKGEEARQLFREALAVDPHHPEAKYNHAILKWRLGELDDLQVVKRMEEVVEAQADGGTGAALLGLIHLARGAGAAPASSGMGCLGSFPGHKGYIQCLIPTPDGRHAVTAGLDKAMRLWELETGRCLRVIGGLENTPFLAATHDGRHVLAQGVGGAVSVWELATGRCVRRLEGHEANVLALALSADGRHAVSGAEDGTLAYWDVAAGRRLRALRGPAKVRSLALTSDGRRLLEGGEDGAVRLWDTAAGKVAMALGGHKQAVVSLAVAPDGRLAVSASHDDTLRVWDLASGACLRTLTGHSMATSVAISPDGRRILSGGMDKTVRLWDLASGVCLRTFTESAGSVYAVAFTPDGRGLSGGSDKTLRVWGLAGELPSLPPAFAHFTSSEEAAARQQRVAALRAEVLKEEAAGGWSRADALLREARALPGWQKDPGLLALADRLALRGVKKRLASFWVHRPLRGHAGPVTAAAVSPDEGRVLSAGADNTVRLWELETGRCLFALEGREGRASAAGFLPDGAHALLAGEDGTLGLLELGAGKFLRRYSGHRDRVNSLDVAPDGGLGLSGGEDGTVRLWNLAEGGCRRVLTGHRGGVKAVLFTPDGRRAVSAGDDAAVRVWDLADGKCLRVLAGHEFGVHCLALSRDGAALASGGGDHTLRLWDPATGECRRVFEETAGVSFARLFAEGRHILTGLRGASSFRVRELAGDGPGKEFDGHAKAVTSLALSASGRYVVSGGEDAALQVWRLDWEHDFTGNIEV